LNKAIVLWLKAGCEKGSQSFLSLHSNLQEEKNIGRNAGPKPAKGTGYSSCLWWYT